jgi:WD40 repeat protein
LPGTGSREGRTLGAFTNLFGMAFDPRGRYLIVTTYPGDNTWIVPLDGSPPRRLSEDSSGTHLTDFAFSPTGRYVARAVDYGSGKTLRVWDVDAGVLRVLDVPVRQPVSRGTPRLPAGSEGTIASLAFIDDSTLYTAGDGGIYRWNLETGAHALVKDSVPAAAMSMTMSDDRRVAFTQRWSSVSTTECAPLEKLDLATGVSTPLPAFGDCPGLPAVAGPLLASATREGILVVRASRVSAREAHLLPGQFANPTLAISPDLKWVVSASQDNTLRLWPMPNLDQPPLHTLPRGASIAHLRSLTNLRAVRDEKSSTGWSIELGPFPGWKNIPSGDWPAVAPSPLRDAAAHGR